MTITMITKQEAREQEQQMYEAWIKRKEAKQQRKEKKELEKNNE